MLKACMRRLPGSIGQNSPVCTDLTGEKGVGSGEECVTYATLSWLRLEGGGHGEEMNDFVHSLVSVFMFLRRPYYLALT